MSFDAVTPDEGRQYLVERLEAVAGGDRAALRDIYERTSAKLFGVCLRILPDREEAEDVLQDVYLTVWNKAERFDPSRASPITWLATIARNRAIDRQRALGPRAFHRAIDDALDVAEDAPDVLTQMERVEENRQLTACLETLDARTRGAIVSAFFGGRTYETLAADESLPLGTMKSLIRRGLQRLKNCLQP
ncbi:RNA polymerase sigma factor [Aureimonas sp. SA4125]|uniref:sigma-70 family RNA polymerase sigma factor n=1 Tax=Aureimonas sp. SA4125 TaxID=2826993 RepID=UPI001CC431D0|nr:sigma-70 family RNA polymerase sigma factor [Aureimonas sp. SA4125]BDA82545.1 RNA polymerase sigma factor [Aureimonas sp. SA4125]